jgi:predicted nucleic acid-binding protein
VAYVLTSRKGHGVAPADVAEYLWTIVSLPGMRRPSGEKQLYLRAIELFEMHSTINMADALVMARAEKLAIPLATFDRALDQLPYAESWQFLD